MIELKRDIALQRYNTLAVPSVADYFVELVDEHDIAEIVMLADELSVPIYVLGGGSNLVLKNSLHALVVFNKLKGIHVNQEINHHVHITVGAGENWHDFVAWTVEQGFSGIENLALIPGTVGAGPVQNIGAYGVEISDVIEFVAAFDLVTRTSVIFNREQCLFGYRDSVFKQCKGRYLITSVGFRLAKGFAPVLNYGPLQALKSLPDLTAKQVFDTVISVRMEKLPIPEVTPNAGSFFKNPVVSRFKFEQLQEQFPTLVGYAYGDQIKLAAGWLIDQCGLKGQCNEAGVGCYGLQALVLVNPNKAPYEQVIAWAEYVQQQVFEQFSVRLEMEPQIWG